MADGPRRGWHGLAREQRAAGRTLQEIAETHGVTRQAVWLATEGVACPVDHRSLAGQRSIVHATAALRAMVRTSKWTPEQDAYIRSFYRWSDKSAGEIGKHLGVSRNAIIGRARRLGLHRPKNGSE